jgi:hypothetical protein
MKARTIVVVAALVAFGVMTAIDVAVGSDANWAITGLSYLVAFVLVMAICEWLLHLIRVRSRY